MLSKKEKQDFLNDNLSDTKWKGVVVDVNDPDFEAKVKVRVFGKYDLLEVEDIPWAYPNNFSTGSSANGSGSFSLPKLGSIVEVTFDNGDQYHPIWHSNYKISNELKLRIGNEESYKSAQSAFYDVESNFYLYHTEPNGLVIRTKSDRVNDDSSEDIPPANEILFTETDDIILKNLTNNEISILNSNDIIIQNTTEDDKQNLIQLTADNTIILENNITESSKNQFILTNTNDAIIETADGNLLSILANGEITLKQKDGTNILVKKDNISLISNKSISLGSLDSSAEPAVLGETLESLLNEFMTDLGKISGISTPAGPSGMISTSPFWQPFVQKFKAKFKTFLSNKVSLD